MSSWIWEQLAALYLMEGVPNSRGMFIHSQYPIQTFEPRWDAKPDFLALSFPTTTAWMIEVTTDPLRALPDKISQFRTDYVQRIKSQLAADKVPLEPKEEWCFGLWAFVPTHAIGDVENLMAGHRNHGSPMKVTGFNELVPPKPD